jgi:hypothetical protein
MTMLAYSLGADNTFNIEVVVPGGVNRASLTRK